MMALFIQSYLSILLGVGLISIGIFLFGLRLIFKYTTNNEIASSPEPVLDEEDYSSIAGDDVIATQLDLARAYVETGQTGFAKSILETVLKQGSEEQQQEAQRLLNSNI